LQQLGAPIAYVVNLHEIYAAHIPLATFDSCRQQSVQPRASLVQEQGGPFGLADDDSGGGFLPNPLGCVQSAIGGGSSQCDIVQVGPHAFQRELFGARVVVAGVYIWDASSSADVVGGLHRVLQLGVAEEGLGLSR